MWRRDFSSGLGSKRRKNSLGGSFWRFYQNG
jgi:hypothetical protein